MKANFIISLLCEGFLDREQTDIFYKGCDDYGVEDGHSSNTFITDKFGDEVLIDPNLGTDATFIDGAAYIYSYIDADSYEYMVNRCGKPDICLIPFSKEYIKDGKPSTYIVIYKIDENNSRF